MKFNNRKNRLEDLADFNKSVKQKTEFKLLKMSIGSADNPQDKRSDRHVVLEEGNKGD